ncbi:uncharacterized protein LOC110272957 [Arachis duranensis]|uniref:Uncharacterized protein LOC110272957 n=1 Tax=Arachis duranensis TaxID=130453 RepID=A0A9C6TZY9_ARADU|nr:uncharacterized protein LOC110272957 [Arachis duranensis]
MASCGEPTEERGRKEKSETPVDTTEKNSNETNPSPKTKLNLAPLLTLYQRRNLKPKALLPQPVATLFSHSRSLHSRGLRRTHLALGRPFLSPPCSAAELSPQRLRTFLSLLPGPPRGQSTTKPQPQPAVSSPTPPSHPAVAQHHPLTQHSTTPPPSRVSGHPQLSTSHPATNSSQIWSRSHRIRNLTSMELLGLLSPFVANMTL